jgi:argininosuccinate lyase
LDSFNSKPMNPDPSNYGVSLRYDRRLYRQDIAGSVAHARMLAQQGIITRKEAQALCDGLEVVRQEIEEEKFPWRPELEDLHMNIEARLKEKVGPLAGKLHTARSRNDQVALDMRMYAKEVSLKAVKGIELLQKALVNQAEAHQDLIIPGYTHMQRAQPVLLAHHLLAYYEMLQRDGERFRRCHAAADVMPLGSGALAGAPYPLDRDFVARELGFGKISANSMDAVADRDFLVEFHSTAALCMMHLSRLAEELVLWSSQEFAFITLNPRFTTGSSIMPQKRNPDYAELARGKTGRVYGHLVGILTTLKGLPLTYNRDLQEDKEGFFDTVDTILSTLDVFAPMVGSMTVNAKAMAQAAEGGNMLATDLADYLVGKGLPFREAHGILRQVSEFARDKGKEVHGLGLDEYRQFSDLFDEDVHQITLKSSVDARDVPGGTAPVRVRQALARARKLLEERDDG